MRPKNQGGGDFKAVPVPAASTTHARCYSMIHIGQVDNIFNGVKNEDFPYIDKVMISWELPKLTAIFDDDKGAQPFSIHQEFTLAFSDRANLSKLIANWRGKPLSEAEKNTFDPGVMVGKVCLLQFIHKHKKDTEKETKRTTGNTYLNLQSVSQLPAEMKATMPAAMNPTILWDWDLIANGEKAFSLDEWNRIPGWIRKKMQTSLEYQEYAKHIVENTEPPVQEPTPTASAPAVEDNSDW